MTKTFEIKEATLQHAIRVFGSEEEARHWICSPAYGLAWQKPIDLLNSELGAIEVENYLGAIEYGNYW